MTPKYQIGDKVVLDPTGSGRGPTGRIMAVIFFENDIGYIVSTSNFDGVVRHTLDEDELQPVSVN